MATTKQEVFKIHGEIQFLKLMRDLTWLTDREELELRNLEEMFSVKWSELKD